MKKCSKLLALFLCIINLAQAQSQDKIDILTRRIEELERQQNEFHLESSNSNSNVHSFLRDGLTIGGFFETSFIAIDGKDTRLQAANTTNTLGFNIAADFNPRLKFVAQALTGLSFPLENPNNDPRAATLGLSATREYSTFSFGSSVSQGYLSYTINDHYTIFGGVGYVPFGYYPQQRELVLFVRRAGPQILRTQNLFAPLFNGINLEAHFDPGNSRWVFNVYSFTRPEDGKRPGVGARSWWSSADDRISAGLSYQTAKYIRSMDQIAGVDLRLNLNKFILTTEYVRHMSKEMQDPWSYYVEPSMFVFEESVLVYASFDYSNNAQNKTGAGRTAINDPFKKYEYATGVNWLPTSYTRLRAGLTYNDYCKENKMIAGQERDFISLDLSAGVAF